MIVTIKIQVFWHDRIYKYEYICIQIAKMHPTLNIGTSYSIKKVQYRKIVLFFTSRDVKKRHYRIYPIISDTNISIGIHFETTPHFETHIF